MNETVTDSKDIVTVAVEIDMGDASWRYVLWYVSGWFLMPVLVLASRLLRRKIRWGALSGNAWKASKAGR